MTGGQGALTLGEGEETAATRATVKRAKRPRGLLIVRKADAQELSAHEQRLAALDKASGGRTLWRTFEPDLKEHS